MSVKEIFEVTVELRRLTKLQEETPTRDYTQEIRKQLDLRQKLIDHLPTQFSDKEKLIGKKIVQLNQEINQSMNDAKRLLISEMQRFRLQKKSLTSYRGYNNALLNRSGTYLDKHE